MAVSATIAAVVAVSTTFATNSSGETHSDLARRLCKIDGASGLSRLMGHLRDQPLFARESAGDELVTILDDCSMLGWPEDESNRTFEHDPRLLCGRAAILLQGLFGFEIPPVDSASSDNERRVSQQIASLQMRAYSTGIRHAQHDAGMDDKSKEVLKRRFQAGILDNVPDDELPGLLDLPPLYVPAVMRV